MPDRDDGPGLSVDADGPGFVFKSISGSLSERECEVLLLAARGRSAQEIGAVLFLAESTVKKHLAASRRKLQAVNTTHAVAIAVARRIIQFSISN